MNNKLTFANYDGHDILYDQRKEKFFAVVGGATLAAGSIDGVRKKIVKHKSAAFESFEALAPTPPAYMDVTPIKEVLVYGRTKRTSGFYAGSSVWEYKAKGKDEMPGSHKFVYRDTKKNRELMKKIAEINKERLAAERRYITERDRLAKELERISADTSPSTQ